MCLNPLQSQQGANGFTRAMYSLLYTKAFQPFLLNLSISIQAGKPSHPHCGLQKPGCVVLTLPRNLQSSRSDSRSVRFLWMMRWRRDCWQKPNMN